MTNSSLCQVRSSLLARDFATLHPGVEVWPDVDFHEGGFDYFWICSVMGDVVRNLAYVRVKSGGIEKRMYDQNGDDLWVAAC